MSRRWTVRFGTTVVALAAGLALSTARPAEACSCVASALCQELWAPGAPPPAYFLATVDAIEPAAGGMYLVRLRDVDAIHGATATLAALLGIRHGLDAWAPALAALHLRAR